MPQLLTLHTSLCTPVAQLATALWPDADLAEMIAYYQALAQSSTATCYLLQEENDYIGFIELNTRVDYVEGSDDAPVAYIEGIYIHPAYRHKGYGRLLIAAAEAWAKTRGLTQLCSDTEIENDESIGFHKANGFMEVSRIVCFVKHL
ncbi:aminoglycoside 6'-N-acetyltransferase [Sediminibacterium goheungense]|uniref:Aminoglycoside N(6')-acetyltransferase type 1 n=1 Tax=Sediminibacterium goheungense TaxID=1086393 RepID=A0A4R6J1T0_9BACT|nr:aminoglycoside 6'-N-acetyltransferase [Sediminibacterium goheungense]TDO29220.1 aminoglycoside 6'-N-acetyltransferase I [Sediminibacterium goheungense]